MRGSQLNMEKKGKAEEENMLKRKAPRDLGLEDTTVHTREGGPTVPRVETSMCRANGSIGNLPRNTVQRDTWENPKNITLMVEEKSSHPDLEHRQHRETCLQRT